ncbi:hypothetical protein [Streptomyces albus]|uniref:hypothetical protein n=1 Tax=Streptomyces albus TaxID=1888 RepID=UPI000B1236FF|nr:hypothetical protein [Streptomyces albus]
MYFPDREYLVRSLLVDGNTLHHETWEGNSHPPNFPVPVGMELDSGLINRFYLGIRNAGVNHVLITHLDGEQPGQALPSLPATEKVLESHLAGQPPQLLAAAQDFSGALLFTSPGHAVLGGTSPFLEKACPEGVDTARARFGRYARRLAGRWPNLPNVATQFFPSHAAWVTPEAVEPGSHTARQIGLMRELAARNIDPYEFSTSWFTERRAAAQDGERAHKHLARILDLVFTTLDDFPHTPDLAEPGDLTEDELTRRIRRFLEEIDALDDSSSQGDHQ